MERTMLNPTENSATLTKEQHACLAAYRDEDRQLMALASAAKGRGLNRIEELIRFADAAGWRRLGIAHCVALRAEACQLEALLAESFEVVRIDCKLCRLPAEALVPGDRGVSCNPVGQALTLQAAGTDMNIAMGLCLGHDLLFARHSHAPVTTLAVKDRLLQHNPLQALSREAAGPTG
jgi:uncharacterized metal-binding protein